VTTLKGIEKAMHLTSIDDGDLFASYYQKKVSDLIIQNKLEYIPEIDKIFGDRDIIFDGTRSGFNYNDNCSSNTIQVFLFGENFYVKVDADDKDLIDEINRVVDGDDITKNCGKVRYYPGTGYGGPFLIYDIAN
jgi:hypothetical protein